MKHFIILLMACVSMLSCTADNNEMMYAQMQDCEKQLDEFCADKSMSFLDTVGEGDDYVELCEDYRHFMDSDNDEDKEKFYKSYMVHYKKVYQQWYDLKAEDCALSRK